MNKTANINLQLWFMIWGWRDGFQNHMGGEMDFFLKAGKSKDCSMKYLRYFTTMIYGLGVWNSKDLTLIK